MNGRAWSRVPREAVEAYLQRESARRPSLLTVRRLARQMELCGVNATDPYSGSKLYTELSQIGRHALDLMTLVREELHFRRLERVERALLQADYEREELNRAEDVDELNLNPRVRIRADELLALADSFRYERRQHNALRAVIAQYLADNDPVIHSWTRNRLVSRLRDGGIEPPTLRRRGRR